MEILSVHQGRPSVGGVSGHRSEVQEEGHSTRCLDCLAGAGGSRTTERGPGPSKGVFRTAAAVEAEGVPPMFPGCGRDRVGRKSADPVTVDRWPRAWEARTGDRTPPPGPHPHSNPRSAYGAPPMLTGGEVAALVAAVVW